MKKHRQMTIGNRYTLMWPRKAPAMRLTGTLVAATEGEFCEVTMDYNGKRYTVILDQARWCEAGETEPDCLQVKVRR